ncbi:hypothetical protein [Haladaptatus sp. NG-SE-30]
MIVPTVPNRVATDRWVYDDRRGNGSRRNRDDAYDELSDESCVETIRSNDKMVRFDGEIARSNRENVIGDETTTLTVRLELESAVRVMTNIDWSIVPTVSAVEAAAWSVRLVEARDSLATEDVYVTAGEVETSANEKSDDITETGLSEKEQHKKFQSSSQN